MEQSDICLKVSQHCFSRKSQCKTNSGIQVVMIFQYLFNYITRPHLALCQALCVVKRSCSLCCMDLGLIVCYNDFYRQAKIQAFLSFFLLLPTHRSTNLKKRIFFEDNKDEHQKDNKVKYINLFLQPLDTERIFLFLNTYLFC